MDYADHKLFRDHANSHRSGIVLVTVIVVFTVALALFGIWAKAAIAHQRQLRSDAWRLQAVRLAEAGVRRGSAQRAADPQFEEETWTVPANMLDGVHAGQVRIRIAPAADSTTWTVQATAEYPAGSFRRAQVTKQIEIPNSNSGIEP